MVRMPDPPHSATAGQAATNALALAARGIRVFPCHTVRDGECTCKLGSECKSPGKHPRLKNGVSEATTDRATLLRWVARYPGVNWGQDLTGRAVVDIDVADGKRGEETFHGLVSTVTEDLDSLIRTDFNTLTYRTGRGGTQIVYTLPENTDTNDLDVHLGVDVDFKRGTGSYVMVPGSVTDSEYAVVTDLPELECPGWILDIARIRKKKPIPGARQGQTTGKAILSDLLREPRDSPTKGNDWAIRVAGHLVKGVRHEDALVELLTILCRDGMTEPMAEQAVAKIAQSAIKMQEKNYDGLPTAASGYLEGHPDQITIEVKEGEVTYAHQYLDCGVKAKLIVDDEEKRFFRLEVVGHASDRAKYITVAPSDLVDSRKRKAIFADLGYTFDIPEKPAYKMSEDARLIRYIQNQNPPRGQAVRCLGWHGENGFLTADGVLTTEGLVEFRDVIPHPDAVSQAATEYGDRASEEEALEVLREVATFQRQEVSAVSLAWWVMVLLKGRYRASIAPILYVDATSGSGKSNGFFAFLVALAGNTTGAGTITPPRIKAQLGANRNGIVWVDDVSAVGDTLRDTFRQAASKGSHTKTDTRDNVTSISVHMVGNVLVSCEGLGRTMHEKAMRDRVVHLKVPSVKGRMSLKDPDRPQWDDILDLLARYGADGEDYSAFARTMAGTVVRLVHKAGDGVSGLLAENRAGLSGRHAEKHAILLTGARIVGKLLGVSHFVDEVRAWIAQDEDQGEVNLFLGEIAPRLLRELSFPEAGNLDDLSPAPVWYDGNSVHVNPALCADRWATLRDTSVRDQQLGSKEAIIAELQACGMTARASRKMGPRPHRVSYWAIPDVLSERVINQARGGSLADEDDLS